MLVNTFCKELLIRFLKEGIQNPYILEMQVLCVLFEW
jgi:hypothetical protein